jgi:IS5 family transposase
LRGKPAIEVLFKRFDAALSPAGFLAMGDQGRIPVEWAKKPAKLRQKDRDARWTVKYTKAKPSEDGAPRVDLAIPAFGYRTMSASTAGIA